MKADEALQLVAALLKESGHPDISDVEALDTLTIKTTCADGGINWLSVAHAGPSRGRTPEKPNWPGHPTVESASNGRGQR